jgi:two-component sensor histidine kinase
MFTSADSVRPCPSSRTSSQDALALSKISGSRRGSSQSLTVPDGGPNASDEAALIHAEARGSRPKHASNQRSESEWRQELADKDERFRDLHHRVKNNLQLFSSLLSIEIRNIEDPEAAQHLRDIQHRMHMLVRVHERLYAERDGSADRIDAAKELKALCAELAQSSGAARRNVAITIEAERCEIRTEKLAPLSLILSELVTNALKHAAPSDPSSAPTKIVVCLGRDGGDRWARLSVSDSGPGLPADFDLTRCSGIGMRLVASFVRLLGGTLSIGRVSYDAGAPRGACFTISFPVEG